MHAKPDKSASFTSFTSVAKGKPKREAKSETAKRRLMKIEVPLRLCYCLLDLYFSNSHTQDFDGFITDLLKEGIDHEKKEK